MDANIITLVGGLGSSAAAVAVMVYCWKIMNTMAERWAKEMERTTAQYALLVKESIEALKENAGIMARLEAAINERAR